MTDDRTPTLDSRDAAAVFAELLARVPAFVPEWSPAEGSAGRALLRIAARDAQVVIDRLNRAPDKNLLAFLDLLGVSLIPAQGARAPVVFAAMPGAGDGSVPAGTRVGAAVRGRQDPVVFQTEHTIAMAGATLAQVVSLWPARDEYADHSAAHAGKRPFALFEGRRPVPHELYLAHDTLLAFAAGATVEVELELSTAGSAGLRTAWEHWDGQAWRSFAGFGAGGASGSVDGTSGLTRSGVITLRAVCGKSVPTAVGGIAAHWVRARLDEPLPPDPARVLPAVDRIRLRTVIERPLRRDASGAALGDVRPDRAAADDTQLDVAKSFLPLGRSPERGSAFYFASEEVFGKPGAEVTVAFSRALTPEEEADALGTQYETDANAARQLILQAARRTGQAVLRAGNSILPSARGSAERTALVNKLSLLSTALAGLQELSDIDGVRQAAAEVWNAAAAPVPVSVAPGGNLPQTASHIVASRDRAQEAIRRAVDALVALDGMSPIAAAGAGGAPAVTLDPPRLLWEYWDGGDWRTLLGPTADPAANFAHTGAGAVTFVVPRDLQPVEVDGVTARWIRARLASGSYSRLHIVSWTDSQTNELNVFPVIEPRPPALESFFLGYSYRSPWQHPEHCLTLNDFRLERRSRDVRSPGAFFPPFRPVEDARPALYLGFDRPLPNDLVSLYVDVEETDEPTPPLVWEGWDGDGWRELAVTDETAALRRPGMVSFIPPLVTPRPEVIVVAAEGALITVGSPRDAAQFQPGDRVAVRQDGRVEAGVVDRVEGATIALELPLAGRYDGGMVARAALPRFGAPLDWVRARLKEDGSPARSRLNGVHLNAAWAVQVQTLEGETLGSGTGEPGQALFFTQVPVLPGEQVEVRELEGARAHVELPILTDELLAQGFAADDIRTVSDPRTGKVTEVWVRWRERPHLFFSGPSDRHYVVERARGRLLFGDGRNGRVPTVGPNNIRARRYQAGGGLAGNVPAANITQLLSSAPAVAAVTNPRGAERGAEGETIDAVRWRGPQTLRHRGRAVSASDYEALAREASPGVAAVRILPATAPNGRPAPGWVTVIVVPQSQAPRPRPSFELRRQIRDFLAARAPATLPAERIAVIGPNYLPVGVTLRVAPREVSEAGAVGRRVREALERFLHPLAGGPEGRGWPFGRDVFLSDVAATVEAVDGVDYTHGLELLLGDAPVGERVSVPTDRIVVAGSVRVEVESAEHAVEPV